MGFLSSTLIFFDCVTGAHRVIDKTPFKIGSGADCDWRIDDQAVSDEHCVIQRKGRTYYLLPCNGTQALQLDGVDDAGGELALETDHTLTIGPHLFALHGSSHPQKWLQGMNHSEWFIFDKAASQKHGPLDFSALSQALQKFSASLHEIIVLCRGLTTMGFHAEQVLPWLPRPRVPKAVPSVRPPAPVEATQVNLEYGEFTCPVCWLKFDRGDAMSIAVHKSLEGDSVLGVAHMQRFHATRFNDKGQALDAMGIPAPDLSCPHCRRKLPPGFLDTPHHIFSIVGAPSSGKSYYLTVLVKTLQAALFQHFGVVFRDADPSQNVLLNQMKTRLFSATTPEDAYLAKTDLEADMYERLPRLGRTVALPRPFIFNLSDPQRPESDFAVVFYDNAGEHFEPTRNSADSPGAQHIAAAAGIFFLFDPLHSPEFRRLLKSVVDPQLAEERQRLHMDQQDVILAETEVRIKSLLGLSARERMHTPLAVNLGKFDTWQPLLGAEPLAPVVREGRVDLAAIRRNSDRLRALMLTIAPAVVANAETISSVVRYFALSPLGASPVEFTISNEVTDPQTGVVRTVQHRKIGPDPAKIAPMFVEGPTLWVLSQVAPALIPSHAEV